jgi:TonB-dependent starch-binding outer membrane protein SusC
MQKALLCIRSAYLGHRYLIAKTLLVMKLTILLLTVAFLNVKAIGLSQEVTFSGTNVPLEKVFWAIKKQTIYTVMYDARLLRSTRPINIHAERKPLKDFLEEALANQPLAFYIEKTTIIINKKDLVWGLNPMLSEKNFTPSLSLAIPPITGKIVGSDGQPIIGANVIIKGTRRGTTSKSDGSFSIDAHEGEVLIISSVGYLSAQSVVNNDPLKITLALSDSKLDEVQITAYGSQTRRFSVGNISTVKAEDIAKQPVSNPLLALQGRVPGLFIAQNSGITNSSLTLRLQGQNSMFSGNSPLIVIDGVVYPSALPSFGDVLGGGNPLSFINPDNIESINVLKDADATAIYGSRAANGAILITTKKGKAGRMKLDVNMQQGWSKVARKLKLLNLRQYLDMRYEAYKNDGIDVSSLSMNSSNFDLTFWDTTRSTDWQKELIGGTALYSDLNATVSGGTPNVQYLISGTGHRETTVFPGNFDDKKASLHFSISTVSLNQKFKMQFSTQYLIDNNQLPAADLTQTALQLSPNAPRLYTTDHKVNWEPTPTGLSTFSDNPIAYRIFRRYKNITNNLIANINLTYDFYEDLKIKINAGYNKIESDAIYKIPQIAIRPDNSFEIKNSNFVNSTVKSLILEPQMVFNKNLYNSKLEVLLGVSIQKNNTAANNVTATGFPSDLLLEDINSASSYTLYGNSSEYKYAAAFSNINYILNNKFIFKASIRRDGSSRFGEDSRFHNFGSIGAAWIFSEEDFLKNRIPFLSFGKLKASYGTTGNDQIGDYLHLTTFYTVGEMPYQNKKGLMAQDIPNPGVQWEETRKLNIGLDLGLIHDRILFNINYFRNRSSNQLSLLNLPTITGGQSITTNIPALVQNSGWELSANTVNFRHGKMSWISSINLTVLRNKLLSVTGDYFATMNIGYPLNVVRSPHLLGVDPATGDYVLADKDGKPSNNLKYPDDFNRLYSIFDKFSGGITNTITYKGFQLDFLLTFVDQLSNNLLAYKSSDISPGNFLGSWGNQPVTVLKRWQKPGDVTLIGKYSSKQRFIDIGDGSFRNAFYVRLRNVSLTWNLPDNWVTKASLQSCRIYTQAQNLLTFSAYKQIDPETHSAYNLPPLLRVTAGIQIIL